MSYIELTLNKKRKDYDKHSRQLQLILLTST